MNDRVITMAGRVIGFECCRACADETHCKNRLACEREEPSGLPSVHQAVDQFASDLAKEIHGNMANHAPDKVPAVNSPEFQKLVVESARNVADRYAMSHEWRCFHCDDVFTDRVAALEHFGSNQGETPACKLSALEGGLVKIIRDQAAELHSYREEDNAMARTFYALGGEHYVKERAAEEAGYAKALEQVAKPLAIAIVAACGTIPFETECDLISAVKAVGLGHLIKDPAIAEG